MCVQVRFLESSVICFASRFAESGCKLECLFRASGLQTWRSWNVVARVRVWLCKQPLAPDHLLTRCVQYLRQYCVRNTT